MVKVTTCFVLIISLILAAPAAFATTTLVPLVYDGYYLGWTSTVAGALHFTMVDEPGCNESDWNYTDAQGKADSYGADLSSVPDGSTITAIQVISCVAANHSGLGSSEFRVYYRLNGYLCTYYGFTYGHANLTSTTFFDHHVGWGHVFVKDANTKLEAVVVYGRGQLGVKVSAVKIIVSY